MAQQGKEPAPSDDDRHEKAKDLGEAALGKLAEGQEAEADQLIEKAKRLDESALRICTRINPLIFQRLSVRPS